MADKRNQNLLEKYINDTATPEERKWIESHYIHLLGKDGGVADKKMVARATRHLRQEIQQQTNVSLTDLKTSRIIPIWLRYAAAILVFLSVGGSIYWISMKQDSVPVVAIKQVEDILPGSNRATLTIAGQKAIQLSATHQEIITGNKVTYDDGTSVSNEPLNDKGTQPITELILTTPNGGTYQVTLPDGTQVRLNAASKLKYPSRFAKNQRVVELSGEGYFSVKKDASRPFRVISNGQQVEVLGTEFNISVYDDEPSIKSTLVKGSVRVTRLSGQTSPTILRPGQQSILRGTSIQVHEVDVASVIAWKDGRFSFSGKSFKQVMRELARWYDIDVRYEGEIPEVEFYGGAFRNRNLSTVLQLLESAGLSYRITDRTLIVSGKSYDQKGGM